MEKQKKRRAYERYSYKVPVKISIGRLTGYADTDINFYSLALLNNYSRRGIYFETDTLIPPGTPVTMNIVRSSDNEKDTNEEAYKANVIWCKRIPGEKSKLFGIGLMYDRFGNNCIFGF